jgi:streptogrisin C
MRPIKPIGVCIFAALVLGASPAHASATTPPPTTDMAVLISKGIPPARAAQALALQGKVAETHLPAQIQAALGATYAGAWFEPTTAQLYIGVTSPRSANVVGEVVAHAGLTGAVILTPVRSTWSALITAQNHWNKKLAKLLTNDEAMTGLDSEHNAVSIELSSSVPPQAREALKRVASHAHVAVLITIVPPSHLHPEQRATCKFETKKAYCEKTMVAGVRIAGKGGCTAGPMLIEGNETYMLTAGHCIGEAGEGVAFKKEVASAYPGGAEKEVGLEGTYYEGNERDIAEVKIKPPPSSFTQALPNPVPALMAQWGVKTESPLPVAGAAEVVAKQMVCHQGATSGEHCGEVKLLNVTFGTLAKHLVEISACSDGGDSGGPYFLRTKSETALMMGTEVGGPFPDCNLEGPYRSFFEPLVSLAGAEEYGILSTFSTQALLTTANEVRAGVGLLPTPTEASPTTFTSEGGKVVLEAKAKSKIECAKVTNKGEFTSARLGVISIDFKECTSNKAKCNTAGDESGVVLVPSADIHLVAFKKGEELALGAVIKLKENLKVTCGIVKVEAKGAAVSLIDGVKTLAKTKTAELLFHQKEGTQEFTACEIDTEFCESEGKPVQFKLEANFGTGFEQAGLSMEDKVTFTKEVEIHF